MEGGLLLLMVPRALLRAATITAGIGCMHPRLAVAAAMGTRQCIAANESGQELRRAGRVREAAEKLELCTAPTCPRAVRLDCSRRLTEARRALPTIVFVAKDARGNPVHDAHVTMDGAPVASRLDGAPVPVDVGEHMFELVAEGFVPVSRRLVISEGEKRHEPIVFEEPKTPSSAAPATGSDAATTPSGSSHQRSDEAMPVLRNGGIVGAVLGTASVGVGVAFGVMAKSSYDEGLSEHCRGGDRFACDERGVLLWERAEGQKTISTVTVAGGLVMIAAGAIMFWVATRAPRPPSVTTATRVRGLGWEW